MWCMPWIEPLCTDKSSTVAPAFLISFQGCSSSLCSKPSAARNAMRLPSSCLAMLVSDRPWSKRVGGSRCDAAGDEGLQVTCPRPGGSAVLACADGEALLDDPRVSLRGLVHARERGVRDCRRAREHD